MRAGDIITILISENIKGRRVPIPARKKIPRYRMESAVQVWGISGFLGIRQEKPNVDFGIDASAKNKFGGKGATNREDTLTRTISATVTEVVLKWRLGSKGDAKSRSIPNGRS